MVSAGFASAPEKIRDAYASLLPIAAVPVKLRGWTLDVLRVIQQLNRLEFTLRDVYGSEKELSALHSENRNVRPKIRQQLQVLRNLGMLKFRGSGRYELVR